MVNGEGRTRLPPYLSYRTLWSFIERLQREGVPARIDRSFWGETLSGSNGAHLISALQFLGLLDPNDGPTDRLRTLVNARGETKTQLLHKATEQAYAPLFVKGIDLSTATRQQFEEAFGATFRTGGDMNAKCIRFFVSLAGDSGIIVSQHVTKHFRTKTNGNGTGQVTKKTRTRGKRNLSVPESLEPSPAPLLLERPEAAWCELMLTKFPSFDVNWSDNIKLSWLKTFEELLQMGLAQRNGQQS